MNSLPAWHMLLRTLNLAVLSFFFSLPAPFILTLVLPPFIYVCRQVSQKSLSGIAVLLLSSMFPVHQMATSWHSCDAILLPSFGTRSVVALPHTRLSVRRPRNLSHPWHYGASYLRLR
jgi:hypothetical protein